MTIAATPAPFQAYYCEENAWHAARLALEAREPGPVQVVFLSNANRTCAVWSQRASPRPTEPIVWDYHVVLRVGDEIRDPDCRAGARLPAAAWLAASFPHGWSIFDRYLPRFRFVPAERFLESFASDRRHMRRPNGSYLQPPPAWPPIVTPDGRAHTLPVFLDFEPHEDLERHDVGPWLDLRQFAEALRATDP